MDIKNMKTKGFGNLNPIIKTIIKIIVIVAIALVLICACYYAMAKMGYIKTLKIARELQKQEQVSAEDQQVLTKLGEIMLLPKDVTPTMAIVTDAEVLKKQQPAFFSDVKNGDRVIIYPEMAIVYDYQANKIIKVGPVQRVNDTSATTETQNSETTPEGNSEATPEEVAPTE